MARKGEPTKAIEARTERLYKEYKKTALPGTLIEGLGPPLHRTALYWELRKKAKEEISKEEIINLIKEPFKAVTEAYKDAFKSILEDMPEDLRKQVEESKKKLLERLEALGEPPGKKPGEPSGVTGPPAPFTLANIIKGATAGVKRGLAPLEARFLTFAPGRGFNFEEQTAKNTREQNKLTRELLREIKIQPNKLKEALRREQGLPELALTHFA